MTDSPNSDAVRSGVTVICSDLTSNCLGRAVLLAELAALNHPTRILGLSSGDQYWPPASSTSVPILGRVVRSAMGYLGARKWFREQLPGTKLIVSKPVFSSLGVTILAGATPDQILIDNDDWELGFRRRPGTESVSWRAWELLHPGALNSYYSTRYLDAQLGRYPHKTVSNSFLQSRYGGAVLPHVRDTTVLDPSAVDMQRIRRQCGMQGRVWIGFVGTLRPHKGVDELIRALGTFAGERAPGLYLAGVDLREPSSGDLVDRARTCLGVDRVRIRPQFVFAELSEHLAPVDIICLPGRDEPRAWGQLPAKLIDAMAMGKAVIASGHNDVADLLQGCGEAIDPGDSTQLPLALKRLVEDDHLRHAYGKRARERAVLELNYDVGQQILESVLADVQPFLP